MQAIFALKMFMFMSLESRFRLKVSIFTTRNCSALQNRNPESF